MHCTDDRKLLPEKQPLGCLISAPYNHVKTFIFSVLRNTLWKVSTMNTKGDMTYSEWITICFFFNITSGLAPMEEKGENNSEQNHLHPPISRLSCPLAKCAFKKLYIPLFKKKKNRNIIVFGMSSGLELSKNKTLLQGHEKKYKLCDECDTTK